LISLKQKGVTMRRFIVLPLMLLMAACTTPQERAARLQAEVDQMMVVYGPACNKLGYPAGSDQWRDCVLRLAARDDAERYRSSYYLGYGRGHWGMGGRWWPYY
jgi:hypothetical protein